MCEKSYPFVKICNINFKAQVLAVVRPHFFYRQEKCQRITINAEMSIRH